MFSSGNHSDRDNPFAPLMVLKNPSFFHTQNPTTPFFFSPPLFLQEHVDLHFHTPDAVKTSADQTGKQPNLSTSIAKSSLKPPKKLKETAAESSHRQPARRPNPNPKPRKRAGKKDRHSKICTARGIRDRRMRLSVEVARKFFDLQDILGYNKASCTIEWLFSKSKNAIRELKTNRENYNMNGNLDFLGLNFSASNAVSHESLLFHCDQVNAKKPRPLVPHKPNNPREARENARARARWRTTEKMMSRRLESQLSSNDQIVDLQKLGFSEIPAESIIWDFHVPGTIEKFVRNSSFFTSSDACSTNLTDKNGCDYENSEDLNSSVMEFWENWEMFSNSSAIDRVDCSDVTAMNQAL